MNFLEFNDKFPNEKAVIDYYIGVRYGGLVKCNHCGSSKISNRRDRPKFFQCNNCNNSFSIFQGTMFQKSRTDVRKWMYAIYLFLNSKKRISGYQLQREVNVTYKTAWRMLKLIREGVGNDQTKKTIQC